MPRPMPKPKPKRRRVPGLDWPKPKGFVKVDNRSFEPFVYDLPDDQLVTGRRRRKR